MLEPATILIVMATFLTGGLVKGALGLGLPVVALAFLAAPLGLKAAMAVMLAPCLLTNIWQAFTGGSLMFILRGFWSFFLAAAIGIWFGVSILAVARNEVLLGLLGVVLCAYSVLAMTRPQIPPPRPSRRVVYNPIAGGLGGLMFGMTGTFIVPGLLYLQAMDFGRNTFVQAMGIAFLVITSALTISMTGRSLITQDLAILSLTAIPPTFAGMIIGRRIRHRISEELFRRLFFIALFVTGVYMLTRALIG